MRDSIPAGFMTLPEALQRIRNFVTNAQLDAANNGLQEFHRAFREQMQKALEEASERDPVKRQPTEGAMLERLLIPFRARLTLRHLRAYGTVLRRSGPLRFVGEHGILRSRQDMEADLLRQRPALAFRSV